MPIFAPALRKSVLAVFGIAAAATTAMAQGAPKAQCPSADMGEEKECPPQEPVAEEPAPAPMPEPQPQPQPTYEPVAVEPVIEEDIYEPYGIAVSLGGGIAGFTDDSMRDTTDDGGMWGVRAAFGLRSILAFEAEYTGSAQSIDALGIDNDSLLVGNGLQGVARLNLLQESVQPFLFGGIGWRHYELASEGINTSDIQGNDDVLEVPVGVGVAWTYEGFMLDARGELRYAAYENMVPDPDLLDVDSGAAMHRYGVNINIGYSF